MNVKIFETYSKEWVNFIVKNRLNENEKNIHNYDIIYGPIANDKVGVQIRNLLEDNIDLDTFIERLKYIKGITFQFFFGTEKTISNLYRKMSEIEYMNECTTRDVITMIVEKKKISITDAMNIFYNSRTFAKLINPESGFYFQSAVYIYDILEKEIKL